MQITKFVILALFLNLFHCEKLVLVGGALKDDNKAVYTKFIEMSTVSGNQFIGIVTAASATPEEGAAGYIQLMKGYGATNIVWLPLTEANPTIAYDNEWVQKASQMTGIFFGGGDQELLVNLLYDGQGTGRKDTPLLKAIRDNVKADKTVVGGSSAGTSAQQSTPMVTGGESYYGLKYRTQESIDSKGDKVSFIKVGGLGLFTQHMYLDSHFSCRGRQGRFISLINDNLSTTHISLGAGIDENTALVVDGDNALILGEEGVSFFDLSQAKAQTKGSVLNIQNVRLTYLTDQDELNLKTLQITKQGHNKVNIKKHERYSSPKSTSIDIFSSPDRPPKGAYFLENLEDRTTPREFTLVAQDLFDSYGASSTHGYTYEMNPEFRVDLTKDSNSVGYVDLKTPTLISFEKLRIDISSDTVFLLNKLLFKTINDHSWIYEVLDVVQYVWDSLKL